MLTTTFGERWKLNKGLTFPSNFCPDIDNLGWTFQLELQPPGEAGVGEGGSPR